MSPTTQPPNAYTLTSLPQIGDLIGLGELGVMLVTKVEGFTQECDVVDWRSQGFEVIYSVTAEQWQFDGLLQIIGIWNGEETVFLMDGNPVTSMMSAVSDEMASYTDEEPLWIDKKA